MTDIKRRKLVTLMGAGAAVIPLSALVTSLPSLRLKVSRAATVHCTRARKEMNQVLALCSPEARLPPKLGVVLTFQSRRYRATLRRLYMRDASKKPAFCRLFC